jgi:hypothetical protein
MHNRARHPMTIAVVDDAMLAGNQGGCDAVTSGRDP